MAVPAWATVFTNATSITINDAATVGTANPYPSTINVSGLTGNITNITVTFDNFNHTFPDDMDIMLVSPSGKSLMIMSDSGGTTDLAVWRGTEGNWYVRNSTGSNSVSNWGQSGDIPVPGHYGGSATAIRAVYRPSENNWYLNTSPVFIVNWGASGDILVPGDYDANGATDFAVWRPSEGRWYVRDSTSGTVTIRVWGLSTDTPVPGDYDGDARTDFAVWRPSTGDWYILNSGTTPNAQRIDYQGQSGDKPIPSAYVQQ